MHAATKGGAGAGQQGAKHSVEQPTPKRNGKRSRPGQQNARKAETVSAALEEAMKAVGAPEEVAEDDATRSAADTQLDDKQVRAEERGRGSSSDAPSAARASKWNGGADSDGTQTYQSDSASVATQHYSSPASAEDDALPIALSPRTASSESNQREHGHSIDSSVASDVGSDDGAGDVAHEHEPQVAAAKPAGCSWSL